MAAKKRDEFTECTVLRALLGHERDDDGRRKQHFPGEDIKLPRQLAKRLSLGQHPRVAIDEDARKAARAQAKPFERPGTAEKKAKK